MALGGVFMTDSDGNIGTSVVNLSEKVCGLLFDISGRSNFWSTTPGSAAASKLQDTVVELNSIDDAVEAGIAAWTELTASTSADYLLNGVAYYHIKNFFTRLGGSGRLFVMFADCSSNWNALRQMQQAAQGQISQIGVWTEQMLWKVGSTPATDPYVVETMVADLQTAANDLANNYHAPLVVLLNANTGNVKTASDPQATVALNQIPTVIGSHRYVSVLLGQDVDSNVAAMQIGMTSHAPVGTVGLALAELALGSVGESIGWVQQHDLRDFFSGIEFGFGDLSVSSGHFASTTDYDSLTKAQLDALEDKGYIFPVKYAGLEGHVYFSSDRTANDGDYRTLSRNRVINKSRRVVRAALLPYVNAPLKVDPANGRLSTAQIAIFTNLVSDVLNAMVSAEEVSGIGSIVIPADQNVLKSDKLILKYTLIPLGTAKTIEVTEGFALSQS